MASLVPQVTSALIDVLGAGLGSAVTVYDGPEPRAEDQAQILVVGWTEDDDTTDAPQSFGPMATTRPRNQEITVPCLLRLWTGDVDATAIRAARVSVYALFATVESVIRTNPNLSLSMVTSYLRTQIVSERHRARQVHNGLHSEILFTVQADCRI